MGTVPKSLNIARLKLPIIALATTILLAAGVMSTTASLSNSGSSTVTAAAGTLAMGVNDLPSTTSLTMPFGTDIYPGMTAISQTLKVQNRGTVPMQYELSLFNSQALAARLNLEIRSGSTVLYNGKLNAVSMSKPTVAAGGEQNLTFLLTWPAASDDRTFIAGNYGQNANGYAVFYVRAASV